MKVKGHCPNCGPGKWATVEAEFKNEWTAETDDDFQISGRDVHRILCCGGCERVYFQTSAVFSEDNPGDGPTITHWPPPERRQLPIWTTDLYQIDRRLYSVLSETYAALNADLKSLAAIGLRTIFDIASEMLGVDPNRSFFDKLNDLVALGKIGQEERGILDALTVAGSAAAHRGWSPRGEQLDTMIDIIEGFLHRSFFVLAAAKKLKASVPARGLSPTKKGKLSGP